MANTVSDVMTRNPVTVEADDNVGAAAQLMRQHDTGAIVVVHDGAVVGIVTDRDIAIRIVAEGLDGSATVRQACSAEGLTTVSPDTSLEQAVQLMRQNAIRRLPVMEGDRAVGMVSLGDLAVERDSSSALADISAATATR
jgi:CBS domain-containing protein